MAVDLRFLRAVQSAGWWIISVDQTFATVQPRWIGGASQTTLVPGQPIPEAPRSGRKTREVSTYDDLRGRFRAHRQDLGLIIEEVEEAVGLTTDHLAKMEQPIPTRRPTLEIVTLWAQALGYELALCPQNDTRLILRPDPSRRMGIIPLFDLAAEAGLLDLLRPIAFCPAKLRVLLDAIAAQTKAEPSRSAT